MTRPVTPLLSVDIVIRQQDRPGAGIVLIERRNPPYGWALPGGFVDLGETLEQAALREAREETCLQVSLLALLGCYSDPDRDPRGPTVSAVYVADARGRPEAADDAKSVRIADPADRDLTLAFDHRLILDDYLHYLETGEPAPLRPLQGS
jgi:8-oxo-dGTP diphosphatase